MRHQIYYIYTSAINQNEFIPETTKIKVTVLEIFVASLVNNWQAVKTEESGAL